MIIKKQIFAVVLTLGLSGSSQVHAATDWYRVARVGGRIGCFTGGVGCVAVALVFGFLGCCLGGVGDCAKHVSDKIEKDMQAEKDKTTKKDARVQVIETGVGCTAMGFGVLAYVGAFGMFAGAASTAILSVPLFYFALRK